MRLKAITASVAALVAVPAIIFSGSALAAAPSSIESGDIYRVRNVTKNNDFSDPNSADACDTVQYKVRIHNGGPHDILNNVVVQASIPNAASTKNVSTIIVRADNASPSNTSDTATLNISSAQKVTYVNGTTQLLDANNNVIRTLPDVITGAGVNIGSVGISLNEKRFVQFQAKVGCPETPPAPSYSCDAFSITADANRLVKVTAFSTSAANGAVYKNASVDWGDGSAQLTDANIIGKTHQYDKEKDGTYTITATARFTVDGKEVTASGPKCVQQVTFKGDTPPTVTPPTTTPPTPGVTEQPSKLVNTGAGSTIALFAAAMAAGTALYRRMLTRRLSE